MNTSATFGVITVDRGVAAGVLRVSPMYARYGPCRRGAFVAARHARAHRSLARHQHAPARAARPRPVAPS